MDKKDMETKTVATVNNLPEIEAKPQKSSEPLLLQTAHLSSLAEKPCLARWGSDGEIQLTVKEVPARISIKTTRQKRLPCDYAR